MAPRRSPRQIVTWTVILTAMAATLTVLWNVIIVQDHFRLTELARNASAGQDVGFRWFLFSLGIIFLIAIVIGLLMMGVKLLREVDFSQKQSNFIAGVTHEFKSPLAAIRISAETLLTREMSESDRRRFLEGIVDEVDRLGRLVNNILAAGKIDLHRDGYVPAPSDLAAFARGYFEERRRALGLMGVRWDVDAPALVGAGFDPFAMRLVVDNLVENALKYSEGQREIRLSVIEEGGMAVLRVADNGIGIDPEDARHLFDRFYRGRHQPRRRVPGTGLGLFLARSIVEAHGGTLRLMSPGPGQGTVAEMRLPAIHGAVAVAEVA